nr:hypothetical protein [Tanacetum cinerariifolium]
ERPQGALPSDAVPNPMGEIKVITTQSGIVLAGPLVPPPPLSSSSSSSKESSLSLRSSELPLSPASRSSDLTLSPASRSSELTKRNPHQHPIPYPSRLNKEKLQDKSDIQIHKFLQMFKQHHINISLAKALLLCQSVSINLMPLSVRKKLMLPKLVPTRMTLELANWYGAYPIDIAEDVFVPVGKFTFPADFVVLFSLLRHTQYVLSKQRICYTLNPPVLPLISPKGVKVPGVT